MRRFSNPLQNPDFPLRFLIRFFSPSAWKKLHSPFRAASAPLILNPLIHFSLFLFPLQLASAQSPIGTWQTHFSYRSAQSVEVAGKVTYCATYNGFFYYDQTESQATKYSKIDGLSETGISALRYEPQSRTLVLAYRSGTIDLLSLTAQGFPLSVRSLNLLRETTALTGSRRINHIEVREGIAYLSGDFGVAVLDVAKGELRETYRNIGPGGAAVSVFASAFFADSLYLATSKGVLSARFSPTVNLQDFANWRTNLSGNPPSSVVSTTNRLFAPRGTEVLENKAGLWAVNGSLNALNGTARKSTSKADTLLVPIARQIYELSSGGVYSMVDPLFRNLQQFRLDGRGKLWLADDGNGLLTNATGSVRSVSPATGDTTISVRLDSIVTDKSGLRWTILGPFRGIRVENPATGQQRFLNTLPNQGGLPSATVHSLAVDRTGQVWAATASGIAVFDFPDEVLTANVNAYFPVYSQHQLLANENCTALVVDGGNRKWIGTDNGTFLFNPDGTQLLLHFTETNSPLPTNFIRAMRLDSASGSIYFDTPGGMVSYRGTATEGASAFNSVRIFPNPVRPSFGGVVGMEGLVENSLVKITDVTGRVVFQTHSNGGTATWNVLNPQGLRAESGVYLIFMASPDGKETLVGKLAVVN